MTTFKKDKKDDENSGNVYQSLDKTAVLQEARVFNESPLNPKRCLGILTRILYIISRGDKLSRAEATDAFFAMTKLFQNKDLNLRRMMYLVIKEMTSIADNVIVVTSSLQKDIIDKDQSFRAPALRALCKIIDPSLVQMLERHLREAIVNKNSPYACAAITSAYHLMHESPDLIKRCSNEIQEAASCDRQMVQYHALGLLYQIKRDKQGSVIQMLQRFVKLHVRSPFGHCLLIRMIFKYLQSDETVRENDLVEFLDSSLRHKSEMVVYEAARTIVNLRSSTPQRLSSAINVLQVFCSSPKAVMRYAAVRTLNNVAMRMPSAAVSFNTDLETLISDPNRSIATLAITTLLKVGNESSIDRLLKQISNFMNEITDEFKVVVVESIRNLATKYPKKYQVMLTFLSTLLRDNDGYKFKKVIVSAIESIIKEIPEAKSAGLIHLCEFIEDCEHTKLTQRILYLIGQEGPHLKNPRKYIRYIYNRIMLEDGPVRGTATTALARFGAQNADLLPSVMVLLNRITLDEDDEVRDRATVLRFVLLQNSKELNNNYLLLEMKVSPVALERQLKQYYRSTKQTAIPFDLKQVPIVAAPIEAETKRNGVDFGLVDMPASAGSQHKSDGDLAYDRSNPIVVTQRLQEQYIEELSKIPFRASLGPLFKSSAVIELTEPDLEYFVTCVKHIFANYIVLQYNCKNTMNNVILEDVNVEVQADGFDVEEDFACARLEYDVLGKVYVVLRCGEDVQMCMGSVTSKLVFNLREKCDGEESEPYEDDYSLEPMEITIADNVQKIMKTKFDAAWQEFGDECEKSQMYSFDTIGTIEEMVKKLEELGLQACEGSGVCDAKKSSHVLLLAGTFRSGDDVLVTCKIVKGAKSGVTVQFLVRCEDSDIGGLFAEILS